MNTLVLIIDEFHIASHSDDQSRRYITRRNICPLNFLPKEFGTSSMRRYRQLHYQRE
jgi:hypothetical protein